jgi:hypothetical protein
MINTNIIDGLSIYMISDMFIAKINEPLVQSMGDDFFVVHDCIHWFTGLGVSLPEEKIASEIQTYMLAGKIPSPVAQVYILRLQRKGVYKDLQTALIEAKAQLFAGIN